MKQSQICQSCGIKIGPGFYGTNSDGSANIDYCKYCYQMGNFTEPLVTLQEMIERTISNMMNDSSYTEIEARDLAQSVIPNLKRWM